MEELNASASPKAEAERVVRKVAVWIGRVPRLATEFEAHGSD